MFQAMELVGGRARCSNPNWQLTNLSLNRSICKMGHSAFPGSFLRKLCMNAHGGSVKRLHDSQETW